MAHFAHIQKNIVTEVIVIANEICGDEYPASEPIGQDFIANTLCLPGLWLQTSYNANFRGCYAGIGFIYDSKQNVFMPPPDITGK